VASVSTAASEQQAAQIGLVAAMLRDLEKIWPLLKPQSLNASLPQWIAAVHAVVARFGPMAASLAADHYDAARDAAKIPGRYTVVPADSPDETHVDTVMRWATSGLWDRDLATMTARIAAADQKSGAVATKLVADVARQTIVDAVHEDDAAVGWARVAKPHACAFCRLLTTRGGVYTSETVKFRAHNGCSCTAEPVFKGQRWEPSANVREWQAQYKRAAVMSGNTITNFRRVVEGRA
jgi:hypothetical protein